MINPDDFRLSPKELAEMAAMQQSTTKSPSLRKSRSKREIGFYQFPKAVMDAFVRSNYMPVLAVAMAVYKGWFLDFEKRNPVKLTSNLLAEFRISRGQKLRALKILEKSDQFVLERYSRRNPLVTMKWILIKD
jgi:hypothetical protein